MGKETSFYIHVTDVMNQNIPLIERDMPLSHLINALLKTKEKNAIIIDRNEKATGLITPKIFFKNIINLGHFWKEGGTMLPSKYVELIAEKVPTIPPQTPLIDVIKIITTKTPFIDGTIIQEKDEILGIITAEDILKAVLDDPLLSTQIENILPKEAEKRKIQKYSTIARVIQTAQELDTDCLVVFEAKNEPWGLITASSMLFEIASISQLSIKKEESIATVKSIEGREEPRTKIQKRETITPLAEHIAIQIPEIITQNKSTKKAIKTMLSEDLDGIPIMNKNKKNLRGVLIKKDIIKYLAKQKEKQTE